MLLEEQFEALCSLVDPTRRSLYEHISRAHEPVSRDDAAEAVGVDRSVAAYHLDKLVDEGLLTASFARPEGRSGPGAGRPAKHYEHADVEVAASAPPRDYRLMAELLARALDAASSSVVADALRHAAADLGAKLANGADSPQLWDILEQYGYQPYQDGALVRLNNCPFRWLSRAYTDLVCSANLTMMTSVLDRLDAGNMEATQDLAPDRCCVAFFRR